jgi:translocation and assembly module TamB
MRRQYKIALLVLGSLACLALILVVAGILIVRTQAFRNFVHDKIVSETEMATGGTVELGAFSFDWRHLRAVVRDFVIHGTEPAGAPPLFRAKEIELTLKLTSPFKHMVDIYSLVVDSPQANVIVYPDGHTNVPAPKIKKPSDKNGLETIVDLAIQHFDLRSHAEV